MPSRPMTREQLIGAIAALEDFFGEDRYRNRMGMYPIPQSEVDYAIDEYRAQLAALPEPTQQDSARDILADIIRDLPTKRDWLDPVTERRAKALLSSPEPAQPWTSREWKMREAISKAWTAQTFHEAQDALRPIIQDVECTRPDGMAEPPSARQEEVGDVGKLPRLRRRS